MNPSIEPQNQVRIGDGRLQLNSGCCARCVESLAFSTNYYAAKIRRVNTANLEGIGIISTLQTSSLPPLFQGKICCTSIFTNTYDGLPGHADLLCNNTISNTVVDLVNNGIEHHAVITGFTPSVFSPI